MRLPTPFDRKPSIRNKVHKEGVCTPETQQQRGKRLALLTQYQSSVSTLKKLSSENGILHKTTVTSPNFKETPIISYKKGKSLKVMLVRARI